MSLEDDIKKAFGIKKPIGETEKVVSELGESPINDYSHEIATDSKPVVLKPPPKVEPQTDFKIDFVGIANLSSFQRFFVEALKKVVPGFENVPVRGSKTIMATKFNQNLANYKEVMTELKEVLKARRERLK